MASGEKKVVFCWNPNSLSIHPPFLTTIYNDLLPTSPKLVFHSMCDVTFHCGGAKNSASLLPSILSISGFSSAVAEIQAVYEGPEPVVGCLPDGVLRDLVSLGEFSPLFSIGLPDSPSLPSLSFSSFKALSSQRAISYAAIMRKISEKYKTLQNDPSDLVGVTHLVQYQLSL